MLKNFILEKFRSSEYFRDFLNKEAVIQFIRYIISGISAFTVEYLFFRLLLDTFNIQKFISNSAAMLVGFWFSFLLNRFWSFGSKTGFMKQLSLYSILFLINLVISNLLMLVFSDILHITPSISKAVIMGMVAVWNFVIFKKIIYKK
ncbi:MAG: GtrA family protein [Clostridia bacterium]|nr:GtrA family protein [Clostridia bacterium]